MVRKNQSKVTQTQTQTQTVNPNPKDRTLQEQIAYEKMVLDLVHQPKRKQDEIIEIARKNNRDVGLQPERSTIHWEPVREHVRIPRWEAEVINPTSGRFFQYDGLLQSGLIPQEEGGVEYPDRIYPFLDLSHIGKIVMTTSDVFYDPSFVVLGISRIAQERKLVIHPYRYHPPRVTYKLLPADPEVKNGKQIRVAEIGVNDGLNPPYTKMLKRWNDEEVKKDIELYSHTRKLGTDGPREPRGTCVSLSLIISGRNPFGVKYDDLFNPNHEEVFKKYNELKGVNIDQELLNDLKKRQRDFSAYA